TQESRQLVDNFINTGDFKIVKRVYSDQEMNDMIIAGDAKVGIKIPADYSHHLLDGTTANILVVVDGSHAPVTNEAVNVSGRVALQQSLNQIFKNSVTMSAQMPVEVRTSVLFNPSSRTSNFLVPGLIAFLMPRVAVLLIAVSIVSER